MADEKNPKEASNIFHSIMKASVSKPATEKKEEKEVKPEERVCLYCELPMKIVQPPIKVGIRIRYIYECSNGHTLEVTERID